MIQNQNSSRVKDILLKFENKQQNDMKIKTLSPAKRPVQLYIQRSATCIDFVKSQSPDKSEKYNTNEEEKNNALIISESFERAASENSSNSKRCSIIRRSPAFRMDPTNKPFIIKSKEENDQEDKGKNATILLPAEYPFLSDTLRKALKKPLPSGPPPTKPPRTFESPIKDIPSTDFEPSIVDQNYVKSKVKFLNDTSTSNLNRKVARIQSPTRSTIKETRKTTNTFDCEPGDENIYDEVGDDSTHIYASPVFNKNPKNNDNGSPNNNCCFSSEAGDLHYMCSDCVVLTNDKNIDQTAINMNIGDKNLNKYEKIDILLDAVFDDDDSRTEMTEETDTSQSDKESQCSSSNTRVQRSLTERRKNYVLNVSSSFKNSRQTYGNLMANNDNTSEKTLPIKERIKQFTKIIEQQQNETTKLPKLTKKLEEAQIVNKDQIENRLFECCYLIGYDLIKMKPSLKSIYPQNCKTVPYIEEFVYPFSTQMPIFSREDQNFCLLLTDENGHHLYGYCRQVVPENMEICLPLTYCIVSKVRSTGFYFSVLKEIESRHGQTELNLHKLLRLLLESPIPVAGKSLEITLPFKTNNLLTKFQTEQKSLPRIGKRLSLENTPSWLNDPPSSVTDISKNTISIKRPADLRLESSELLVLYENTTNELLINIFGTLLIERKVILLSKSVSKLSSCIFGLEMILYPFKYQHPIITIVPEHIMEIVEAPFPILVGILKDGKPFDCTFIENGIVVDLDKKILLKQCGDEKTLLPSKLKKPLLISLELVDLMDNEKILSNVLIAEAFIKFFVEIFAYLDIHNFNKEEFIHSNPSHSVRYFLEWFLETSMFMEFMKDKKKYDSPNYETDDSLEPKYYNLFDGKIFQKRCQKQLEGKTNTVKLKKSFSMLMKKPKALKNKVKDFLHGN